MMKSTGRFFAILMFLILSACSHAEKAATTTTATPDLSLREGIKKAPNLPVDESKTYSLIAFGSCADPRKPQPIWNTILKHNPELFLATGDNVYASRPEDKPIWTSYLRALSVPEYVNFRSKVPMLAIWDDHDFGQNDGGIDNPDKEGAKQDFMDFFPNDTALINDRQGGLFHATTIGPKGKRVQLIFMDTRWYRSALEAPKNPKSDLDKFGPTQDKNKTLLGADQWKWLEKELAKPADLKVLVSSIQFIPDEHGFEKWANFPHERQRLLDYLKTHKIRNLVVVSGDRHQGEISRMKLTPRFDLIDITSSGINKPSSLPDEPNRYRVGARYNPVNFGLLHIDWAKRTFKTELRDIDDKVISEVSQKF